MKCRNCNFSKLKKIIFIGKQPLSGIFLKKKKKLKNKYSLDLFICKNCDLVQLGQNANPLKMFGNTYGYQSSISNLMKVHLKMIYQKLNHKNLLNDKSSVLDIGSNDGTFLNNFKKSNKLYGVDPTADKFKKFYKPYVNRINSFFSYNNVKKFFGKNKNIKFDLISSFAMFYDVNDPNKFCRDIYKLLKSNGIWALEFSYFPLLLKNLTYDQICHEHVTYYTFSVFKKIAEKNNFKIINVAFNEINGGSIQIFCAKKTSKIKDYSKKLQKNILIDEKKININSYKKFNKRIIFLKNKMKFFLKKNKNKIIYGYGASTKGNVVLNYCNFTNKDLKYICDANILKENLFTPGSNIQIINKKLMRIHKLDFLFVLIWSFRKEVIKEEIKFIKNGGKLVFMLPRFHVIDKKNYSKFINNNFKNQSYSY